MKIHKLHSKSPPAILKSAAVLLARQMKTLGEKHTCKEVEVILAGALKRSSGANVIMIENDGEPLGVCFFNICTGIQSKGNYIWINEIYVEQKHRGRGYGRALLEYVEKFGRKYGCRYIAAQTDKKNKASRRLFDKSGFDGTYIVWMDKKI